LEGEELINSTLRLNLDLYRLPVFSWIALFFTDLSMREKVGGRRVWAASLSLLLMASLNFFI
jgi:hypothetical protein